MNTTRTILLWDLPTRFFHWGLALLMLAAIGTGLAGGAYINAHGKLGILILGLVAFRLAWGVLGSTYARFSTFIKGPSSIASYLKGQWQGVGHNPLGALSVLGLLGLITLQAVSGLFTNDDIAFTGPLYNLVSVATSKTLTTLHRLNVWALGGLITLHIAAILFYRIAKKEDLVTPMLTGKKALPTNHPAISAQGGGWIALILALAFAAASIWAASGGFLPPPPPPPAQEQSPGW